MKLENGNYWDTMGETKDHTIMILCDEYDEVVGSGFDTVFKLNGVIYNGETEELVSVVKEMLNSNDLQVYNGYMLEEVI